jgi:phage/plasmid-associated DNA primase
LSTSALYGRYAVAAVGLTAIASANRDARELTYADLVADRAVPT